MKLISWNVNGIRSILGKGFLDLLERENPDVVCLQETKGVPESLLLPGGMLQYWNGATKKGYSGTAILTKIKPIRVTYGIEMEAHDGEGRVTTAEFDDCFLVNVYTPNSQRGLFRLPYRMEWDGAFRSYLERLLRKKPVMFCGDLNVAHKEIDIARPRGNIRNAGFTREERDSFSETLGLGFVDSFREFVKEGGHYSWWSYMHNAREKNIGWRIDYVCLAEALRERLEGAFILSDVFGSDHCPVGIRLR